MKIRAGDLRKIIRETVESMQSSSLKDASKAAYKEFLDLKRSMWDADALIGIFKKLDVAKLQTDFDSAAGDYNPFFYPLKNAGYFPQQIKALFENLKKKTAEELKAAVEAVEAGRQRFRTIRLNPSETDLQYGRPGALIVKDMDNGSIVDYEPSSGGSLGT